MSEHLLRGVGHVEEAVLVLVVFVHLSHGEGHAGQPAVVDEQVEGLSGQQSHPVPERHKTKETLMRRRPAGRTPSRQLLHMPAASGSTYCFLLSNYDRRLRPNSIHNLKHSKYLRSQLHKDVSLVCSDGPHDALHKHKALWRLKKFNIKPLFLLKISSML